MTMSLEVYVQLLDEGTSVWRPVQAFRVTSDVYLLQGHVPSGESWQFLPGTKVHCKNHAFADGEFGLIAIEAIHAESGESLE